MIKFRLWLIGYLIKWCDSLLMETGEDHYLVDTRRELIRGQSILRDRLGERHVG